MKILISFLLILSTATSHASEDFSRGLKDAFDELHYGPIVEWDQKDPTFYSSKIQTFMSQMQFLRDSGLSQEDIKNFVEVSVKDKRLLSELKTYIAEFPMQNIDPSDTDIFINHLVKKSYASGARWNPESIIITTTFVVLAVGLLYVTCCGLDRSKDNWLKD